ncbi:MAG: SCP2 sterol-binding domain-containing protein [Spirosomaceae bacterium]|nr:SCP2 sterol-binding domain-containing protein [Spirosomataceae bacterium]
MTAREFLEKIPSRIDPNESKDITTTLHFELSGSGNYTLNVVNGKAEFSEGLTGTPEVALKADADDFVKIASGDMNPMMAVMMGKLKISNPGAMMKYAKMLGLM